MEAVNEQEQAPVEAVVFTAPFDGVAEDDEKDQKELRVVPARVAFGGWQRDQILSLMLRMVRRNMSSMPTEGTYPMDFSFEESRRMIICGL